MVGVGVGPGTVVGAGTGVLVAASPQALKSMTDITDQITRRYANQPGFNVLPDIEVLLQKNYKIMRTGSRVSYTAFYRLSQYVKYICKVVVSYYML
jgi:hypothetical protein